MIDVKKVRALTSASLGQLGGVVGSAVAAACCLGVPVVLTAMGTIGLGFLINDAVLMPIFLGFVGLNLWLLWRSPGRGVDRRPFRLGVIGGSIGAGTLWLLVTGLYPLPWAPFAGLALVVLAGVWDIAARARARASQCSAIPCALEPVHRSSDAGGLGGRPLSTPAKGAMIAAAAAALLGVSKSVELISGPATAGEIKCFGINACRGQSACSTAWNACNGQNACKGKGWLSATAKDCAIKGGIPLEESPADPGKPS